MDPKTVLDFAAKQNAKMLDLRFTDLPGLWHHISFPIQKLSAKSFEEAARLQCRRVFDLSSDDVIVAIPQSKEHAFDGVVVRLSAAAGENHFLR